MREEGLKILVVVENKKMQDYITSILHGEGYRVVATSTQNEGMHLLSQQQFDLIIADFLSSQVEGLKICKKVRENLLHSVPVILLLSDREYLTKAKVILGGADDYINADSLQEELLPRVKVNLWRVFRYHDINPLTKLPGISSFLKELRKRIDDNQPLSVSYTDIFKFKEFNDRYGFKKGDEVIKYTATLIEKTLKELGSPSDFLAHLGGDNFIFISLPESVEIICRTIIENFDRNIPLFHTEEDRRKGYFIVKNRKGNLLKIPLLRISIGIVTNEYYSLFSCGQVIQIANELREYAQKFDKSIYIKERRRSYPF